MTFAPAQSHPAEAIAIDPASAKAHGRDLPAPLRKTIELASRIERGTLTLALPDGRRLLFRGAGSGPNALLIVHEPGFARRLVGGGEIGFAEAYLRGEWETPDLTAFLELFCVNHALIARMLEGRPATRALQLFGHWLNRNTRRGAKRNIQAHYDLGNAFYEAWLDPGMTYSSALFQAESEDLAAAQTRKYRTLAHQSRISPDHHVLEIGCGGGGFAEFAGKEIGCRVTGLTISAEQFAYARRRVFEAGLADKVEIKLVDYRDESGLYDRVVSIEMFEAVGEKFWPIYFHRLKERLKPGGLAGLQIITIQDRLFESYRKEMDFIRRYIFPGGMLPCPRVLRSLADKVGLALHHELSFGKDYALTLVEWRRRFREAWPRLGPLGFDERFRRMWEYYFAYCEAGFRSGNIDVRQVVFAKPGA